MNQSLRLSPHLTDEQMSDLLTDTASQPSAHLRICLQCQSELAGMRNSFADLRAAANAFAAAEAPSAAPHREAPAPSHFFRRHALAASFATGIVLFGMSISLLHPTPRAPLKDASSITAPANSGAESIQPAESDTALLDSIQRDLSASIPPSLEPLAVPAASSKTARRN